MRHRMQIPASLLATACLLLPSLAAQRDRAARGSQDHLVTEDLREAARRGLRWLGSQQHPDGYWSQHVGFKLNNDYRITRLDSPHVGVTALCLISFLAGGHVPGRGEYGDVLSRGVDWVLQQTLENGYISGNETRMYSHAFATLFLAEVYGMTRRQDVRQALQKAVNLIVDSQNAEGGWRYKPFARESDMSITVCQVLALRSARNVGITVPSATIRAAEIYVERSAVQDGQNFGRNQRFRYGGMLEEGGAFRYQLLPHSRATVPLTAAGITTLYAAGNYDHPMIPPALDYLDSNLDDFNRSWGPEGHYFFYYGHYYAVQAYYVTGGERWNLYFRRMKQELLAMQRANGSWPCETGPGEAFGTAVATLILQIPYQYLPIFQR